MATNDQEPTANSQLHLAFQRVAILGLGLMGGSLALALRGKTAAIYGVDPDLQARELALQRGIVDKAADDPAEILPESTLVVLAAPVLSIIALIQELPRLHPGQAVVIDLGSTKVEITQAMAALPERLSPVGGHPMCGKETGSLLNASADLYKDAPFVLVDLPNSTPGAMRIGQELAEAVGARPVWCNAADHDRWVASTSHLPYLLANALAYCTPTESATLAGPGFRSTARLAPSSGRMMQDILLTNRENILSVLTEYRFHLEKLESALAEDDLELLQYLLSEGRRRYNDIMANQSP